jgi:hypothetical protein
VGRFITYNDTNVPLRLLFLLLAVPSFAAELELRYAAIERIIAEQLFTQEGRHYVRGSRSTKCQFAYLEAPHLSSDAGLLRVTARFSGRSALDLFGRCAGMGDEFDLIRRVREALAQSISKDFKIEVRDRARRLLEQPQQELATFDLGDIRVTPNALVLVVDFRLVVK